MEKLLLAPPKTRLSSSNPKDFPANSSNYSLENSDKRRMFLQKEKQLYEKHKLSHSLKVLSSSKEICLLSARWEQEYFEYLCKSPANKKLSPVNSDVISKETGAQLPFLKRNDDKHGLNEILCENLKPSDFLLLDEELMDFLISKYKGVKLKRNVVDDGYNHYSIDYFPLKVKIILLTPKDLVSVEKLEKALSLRYLQVFSSTKLHVFKEDLVEILKSLPQFKALALNCLGIWRLNVEMNALFEDFRQQICEKDDEIPLESTVSSSFFAVDGEKLDFFQQRALKELGFKDEASILLEIRDSTSEPWFLQRKDARTPLKKRNFHEISVENGKENAFPSRSGGSLRSLRRVSLSSFDFRAEALKYEAQYPESFPLPSKGLTGLINLTNSCYMNAALQCLSHTAELRDYFLGKQYVHDICKENCEISYAFALLIRRMWLEKTAYLSPDFMKVLFQKHSALAMYYKNEQHDSQEFLHTFIDLLNEELKRENPEKHKGKEKMPSWMAFLWNNCSVVKELFFGVLKSTLKCPECNFKSLNFEPFLNLSLHFPAVSGKNCANLLLFRENREENPALLPVEKSLFEGFPREFKEKVKTLAKTDPDCTVNLLISFRNAVSLMFDNEIHTLKEQIATHKAQNLVLLITAEKIRPEEGVYSVFFSKFQANGGNFSVFEAFTVAKINRKNGFGAISHCLADFSAKFLGFHALSLEKVEKNEKSERNHRKFAIRLRILDKESLIAVCEQCHATDFCDCRPNFPSFGALENKYRNTNYQLLFEVCFFWENLAASERNLIENSLERAQSLESQAFLANKAPEPLNIYDLLRHFRDPETLCSQNTWFCNKCKKNQMATKQMEIFCAPKVLILHLKRFKTQKNLKTKINLKVVFPLQSLDLTDFVLETPLPEELLQRKMQSAGGNQENLMKNEVFYELYAVINHHGSSLSCGHYTALCRNSCDDRWYKFDDKAVFEVSENLVCTNDAYVLFYKRKNL